jgi:hypothetical protein
MTPINYSLLNRANHMKAESLMAPPPPPPLTSLSIPQYPTYKSIEIFTEKTNIYTYQYSQLFTMK